MTTTQAIDANTSEQELLLHLYERVLSGEMQTFASLTEYVGKLPDSKKLRKCLFKSFELQRKIYWGIFKELTPKAFPLLWQEMVIADRKFTFGGDLKRLMSIPEIYLGLIDIHGYTKYCQDKKRNMSMVDLLDRMIYEDVTAISADSGVITKRAQGDEILVIGASASDVMKAVMQIMDYFNTQGRSFRNTILSRKLPGTVLPKFQISAGISGGQKFTPLVVTRDGDISGDIVNTAARLQTKANRISPNSNRIMITNHVFQKFVSWQKENEDDYFSRVDFFNVGTVEFKGVTLVVYDLIFLPEESRRLELREKMEVLYQNLNKKNWKTGVFESALDVAAGSLKNMIEKGCRDSSAGRILEERCKGLLELIKSALKLFNAMYYEAAISTLSQIVDELIQIKQIDRIVIEYLQLIQKNYLEINKAYTDILDEEVEIRLNDLYGPKEKTNYLLLKKHQNMYSTIQSSTRLKLNNRKKLWHRITDDIGSELNINLQSFK